MGKRTKTFNFLRPTRKWGTHPGALLEAQENLFDTRGDESQVYANGS